MKIKHYIIILGVCVVLLGYCEFCYRFANKMIDNGTKELIESYVTYNYGDKSFEYIKALNGSDDTIYVYILVDSDTYLEFELYKDGNYYKIIDVLTEVPAYIK